MIRKLLSGSAAFVVAAGMVAGFGALSTAAYAQSATRTDSQILSDVNSKLKADAALSNVSVGAAVENGVVTLEGNVAETSQLDAAENDVSTIQGVVKVVDNMQVNTTAPTADVATTPSEAQNEAAAKAQTAQPPAEAQNEQAPADQEAQGDQNQGPPNGPPQPPGPPNGYGPDNGAAPQGYGYDQAPRRPRPVRYDPGNRTITLPVGTILTMRTNVGLQAGKTPVGQFFNGVVAVDVPGDRGVVIPRGAAVTGQVIDSKSAGHFKGSAVLALKLSNLTLGSQTYPLVSDVWGQTSRGKGGQTAGSAVGGAFFGALIGAVAGGGPGAAIGAAAGGAAGAGASGLTPTPQAYVPAEGLLSFRLTTPLVVTTVTPDQAKLLAAAAPPLQRPPQGPPRYGYYPY
jgi:hypothetical protein